MGRPIPPVSLFASDGGLPRYHGGSAPTFNLSRPAQHGCRTRFVFLRNYPAFLRFVALYLAEGADRSRLQMLGQAVIFRQLHRANWRIVSAWVSFQNFSVPLTRRLNCLINDSTNPVMIGNPCRR